LAKKNQMPIERNFFQKIPFIRITSLFLIGILFNHFVKIEMRLVAILLTILISVLIILWHNSNFITLRIQNLLISSGIVLAGIFYPNLIDRPLPSFDQKDYFLAEVCQKPAEKANTFQTILLIQSRLLTKPEKVIAYFNKVEFDSTISTGNQLVLLVNPQKIRNSGNPFEIDYQSMMNRNNIYFSVYLTNGTYIKTGNQINRPGLIAELYRDKLISLLTSAIPEKEERSVVSALTLGYRTEIDQETLDYFASTGAMHVLSVSGLHVALIYFILGFLLGFLKRGKSGIAFFSVVMISFLWTYAFITGFSPAVQRATVMFTFVILGNSLRRQINIYNSLTASAFFLLLLNPDVIFDIGFQLSYLAVFGIVLIQPALNGLLELSNPILKWSWSLFTVSVAAQFITFPLGFYYFNQFPNLFWLSSFAVIPLTTLIIWLTLAFFIFSPLHGVSLLLGIIIEKTTHFMLFLLKEMDALPYAVSRGIVLTPFQVWLLFAGITAIIIYFSSKNKSWLFSALILVILIQVSVIFEKAITINQNVIIIYNSRNPMIHLINGRNNYLLTKEFGKLSRSEKSTIERVRYHLKLNPALIISTDLRTENQQNDLIIKENRLQFTKSLINRKSLNNIELAIYRQGHKTEPESYSISFKNFDFVKRPDVSNFKIKQQGAFYCSLNNKD
jgi:competence protein ComEC